MRYGWLIDSVEYANYIQMHMNCMWTNGIILLEFNANGKEMDCDFRFYFLTSTF